MRRAALQAMRPYTHHQDELNRLLVGALGEADERIEDMLMEIHRVQTRMRGLAGALGDSDRQSCAMLEGVRARPASTHPAISQLDEHGRRVLRFDGAAGDAATYRGFEDIFRGDERAVREQQLAYLVHFAQADWVLDLGCGRGEFLDALIARDIGARGADMDASMVARCVEKGLDVGSPTRRPCCAGSTTPRSPACSPRRSSSTSTPSSSPSCSGSCGPSSRPAASPSWRPSTRTTPRR